MKILIAEDDAVSRLVLSAALRKLGHEVEAATNGLEAWKAYEGSSIRLVISDWLMPEMDGPSVCRKIREAGRSPYTWVILLTALSDRESYVEGMNAGADDFITKPLDPEVLAIRLRVAERVLALEAEVQQLQGILPICSYCKKIRDDKEHWTRVEEYVSQHSEAHFSHSVCPDCYRDTVLPELEALERRERS
jgi:DNA-binding response OmpR family regulator